MSADTRQGIAWAILVTVILQGSFFGAMAQSQASVTLAWNPSAAGDVAGYRLYEGEASGVYSKVLDVTTNTTATVSGLSNGSTYYFAVTAYTSAEVESVFSGEISYTVPVTAAPYLSMVINRAHKAQLYGSAPAGHQFAVLTSRDLSNWSPIGSLTVNSNGSFQFSDPLPVSGARYYRLQQSGP